MPADIKTMDRGHYLLYEDGCATCSAIARAVAAASAGRLRVASLRDEGFQKVLNRTRRGRQSEPILVSVEVGTIRVTTGVRMRLRLVRLLGLRRAVRVATIARRQGAPVLHLGGGPREAWNPTRRWILRWMARTAGAAAIAVFVKDGSTPATAEDCREFELCVQRCQANLTRAQATVRGKFGVCLQNCEALGEQAKIDACRQRCNQIYMAELDDIYAHHAACVRNCPPCVDAQVGASGTTAGSAAAASAAAGATATRPAQS